jgi:hypothetical protein
MSCLSERAKRFMDGGNAGPQPLVGGWQVGSIITLQTGFPITVTSGRDQSNHGCRFRPAECHRRSRLPCRAGQQNPQRFFQYRCLCDCSAFRNFWQRRRNTLIGPGLINWDFSILKNFRIAEGHELQFRFEGFNFANHPHLGSPKYLAHECGFGQIAAPRLNMREFSSVEVYLLTLSIFSF